MKKNLIIFILLTLCRFMEAQESRHYLSLTGGGGTHNLEYSLQDKTNQFQNSTGYLLNLNYSYFFTTRWGIATGVGASTYTGLAKLNYTTQNMETDTDGDLYEFRAKYNNWTEKQNSLFLDIPLTLQFRQKLGKRDHLQLGIGGKVSLPVKSDYKVTSGEITTTGYYSQWNIELSNMPQHGFTTITSRPRGDISLKTAYALTADLGDVHRLNNKLGLYLGGYVTYGLNNIFKADNKLIYQSDGTYNGLFSSSQLNKVRQISYGVKVGLYLAIGRKKKISDKSISDPEKNDIPKVNNDATGSGQNKDSALTASGDITSDAKDSSDAEAKEAQRNNKGSKDNEPVMIQEKVKVVSESYTNSTGDTIRLKRYSVVIGSFIYKSNALGLKSRMEKNGYNIVLAQNERGMYRVIIATFDKVKDAVKECKYIRSKYSPLFYDIWILKKMNDR